MTDARAEVASLLGRTLGHYRIVEKIGEGGMGEVYRARDEHLDCDVAIKVLPPGSVNDQSARKRFHKEARALSRLSHPNIAIVHDFDTQQGVDYLVMEYIHGTTLSERLTRGKFTEKEVVCLGMQLAEGLCAAHEQGVIHSDLKPGNLRLTSDGRLKILDFGLAKFRFQVTATARTETLSAQGTVAGTLPYMAPEQLLAGEVDARTDIHAAGCVLYEMATGRRPFAEVESPRLIGAILSAAPLPAAHFNPDLTARLGQIIGKCLEKEPEDRYQSARELAMDLRKLRIDRSMADPLSSPDLGCPPTEPALPEQSRPYTSSAAALIRCWRVGFSLGAAALLALIIFGVAGFIFRYAWSGTGPTIVRTRRVTFKGQLGITVCCPPENYDSIQTDGRRIYYTVGNSLRYVSVDGGDEGHLPLLPSIHNPAVLHISPDGSTLLVKEIMTPSGGTESSIWLVATDGGSARKLGDVEAHDAAWAPDGRTIAFAKDQDLYLTDVNGNTPVKLTSTSGRAFWLRWSPDGGRLRFTVLDPKTLGSSLWELQRDRRLRQLLKGWKGAGQLCCGVWTADSKYFLFLNDLKEYWAIPERQFPLSPVERVLLSSVGLPVAAAATSPLEKVIFVAASARVADVLKLNVKTGETSSLYPELNPVRATFSRDGKFVAYYLQDVRGGQLWRARADGTDKLQLTPPPMRLFMAQYSPDNKRIAFMARWPQQPWKIYWVATEGGAIHEIPSKVLNQADPNWSPDGQSILFGQPPYTFAEPGAMRALYLYDLRTNKTSEIPNSKGLFSPRWSPDGRYVVAMTLDFKALDLLNPQSGERHTLIQHGVDNPFWSKDSNWVYFNGEELYRVRLTDSHLERVPIRSAMSQYSRISANGFAPDGSILLSCNDARRDVYAMEWK